MYKNINKFASSTESIFGTSHIKVKIPVQSIRLSSGETKQSELNTIIKKDVKHSVSESSVKPNISLGSNSSYNSFSSSDSMGITNSLTNSPVYFNPSEVPKLDVLKNQESVLKTNTADIMKKFNKEITQPFQKKEEFVMQLHLNADANLNENKNKVSKSKPRTSKNKKKRIKIYDPILIYINDQIKNIKSISNSNEQFKDIAFNLASLLEKISSQLNILTTDVHIKNEKIDNLLDSNSYLADLFHENLNNGQALIKEIQDLNISNEKALNSMDDKVINYLQMIEKNLKKYLEEISENITKYLKGSAVGTIASVTAIIMFFLGIYEFLNNRDEAEKKEEKSKELHSRILEEVAKQLVHLDALKEGLIRQQEILQKQQADLKKRSRFQRMFSNTEREEREIQRLLTDVQAAIVTVDSDKSCLEEITKKKEADFQEVQKVAGNIKDKNTSEHDEPEALNTYNPFGGK